MGEGGWAWAWAWSWARACARAQVALGPLIWGQPELQAPFVPAVPKQEGWSGVEVAQW